MSGRPAQPSPANRLWLGIGALLAVFIAVALAAGLVVGAFSRHATGAGSAWDSVDTELAVDADQARKALSPSTQAAARASAMQHCRQARALGKPPAGDGKAQEAARLCQALGVSLDGR
jgi:ABC-type Fe3+ transport system permease subunit